MIGNTWKNVVVTLWAFLCGFFLTIIVNYLSGNSIGDAGKVPSIVQIPDESSPEYEGFGDNGSMDIIDETYKHGAMESWDSTQDTSGIGKSMDCIHTRDAELELPFGRKIILFWSVAWTTSCRGWWPEAAEGITEFPRDAEWGNCFMTRDRSLANMASVIVYTPYDKDPEWPEIRFPNQSYVHILNERPGPWHEWLRKYEGRINLTLNYRMDADIPNRYGYQKHGETFPGLYQPKIPISTRDKSIVWVVSHCKTFSQREDYVKELGKYIGVDIYGKCGDLQCPRSSTECVTKFAETYKFYIAFENNICDSYITEKFEVAMKNEMIPIVMGGGDYKVTAPPHSYLDVRDFKSPKHLAEYLDFLEKNEDAYNAYFQWKQMYKFTMPTKPKIMAQLCKAANDPSMQRPVHQDYYTWWFKGCDNSLVPKMRADGNW